MVVYDLLLWDGTQWTDSGDNILAGQQYTFATPLTRFRIAGIETDAGLDPTDTNAFVTGLTFDGTGQVGHAADADHDDGPGARAGNLCAVPRRTGAAWWGRASTSARSDRRDTRGAPRSGVGSRGVSYAGLSQPQHELPSERRFRRSPRLRHRPQHGRPRAEPHRTLQVGQNDGHVGVVSVGLLEKRREIRAAAAVKLDASQV